MVQSLESRAAMAVYNIYDTARACSMPSDWINSEWLKIWANFPKKTPRYVKTYAEGMRRVLNAQLYSDYLVFGGWIKGQFYSTDSKREDYYSKRDVDPAEWHKLASGKGHYWRKTLKPFFIGEDSAQ